MLIQSQDRRNKSQHSRKLCNAIIKWVCKQLIKHFDEMNLSSMHMSSLHLVPLSAIHTFQVLGTSFEGSSLNKVYSTVTKTNSITNQYKEWFFWLITISTQQIFHGKKWPKFAKLLHSHIDKLNNKPVQRVIFLTHENLYATDFSWKKKDPNMPDFRPPQKILNRQIVMISSNRQPRI